MTFLESQNYREIKKSVVTRIWVKEGRDECMGYFRTGRIFCIIL